MSTNIHLDDKMKINLPKVILASLVGFCFCIAINRIHYFYVESIPIGREGSCYDIKYPDFKEHFQMRIMLNDMKRKESIVMISTYANPNDDWAQDFTFFEQRMLSPKGMKCLN